MTFYNWIDMGEVHMQVAEDDATTTDTCDKRYVFHNVAPARFSRTWGACCPTGKYVGLWSPDRPVLLAAG